MIFNQNVLILQNVPIHPNCTLMTLFNRMFQYPDIIYYWHVLLQLFNKHWIHFFFSSSNMHQSYQLLGCHATGINLHQLSSLNSFLSSLPFSNLICLRKKLSWLDWTLKHLLGKKSVLIREKIETICLTKKLFWLQKKLKQFAWQNSFF